VLQSEFSQALLIEAVLLISADRKIEREHDCDEQCDSDQNPRADEIESPAQAPAKTCQGSLRISVAAPGLLELF
jgi:hypothetical protein